MIRISRGLSEIPMLRAYKIFIDGVDCGKIKRGETKEFEVENGNYTVYTSSGKYGSNTLRVDVNDSTVELEIGNALKGWKKILWPYSDFLVKLDEYLFLREKESAMNGEDAK